MIVSGRRYSRSRPPRTMCAFSPTLLRRSLAPALVLLVQCWLGACLAARETFAGSIKQLSAALQAASPGDTVILKNGTWPDAQLTVSHGGQPGAPLELRAETPGGVIFTGASRLAITAPYVTVTGVQFTDGAITRGAVIQFNSHHGLIRDSAVINYNPADFATSYYWVLFSGSDNTLERCYFRGKNHLGPLVGNELAGSRRNSVVRCYFQDIPLADGNGREILRIWGAGKLDQVDDDGAYFTIAENLFDHADGEGTEIISLKSNHNMVRGNTVIASRGCVNIRRGNFNVIRENLILGRGLDRAMGVRMSGENNLVQGNVISGCTYGIEISSGEFIDEALTAAYRPDIKRDRTNRREVRIATYPQNRKNTIAGNLLVANAGPDLNLGANYKKHWPKSQQVLLPEENRILNNRSVRTDGRSPVVQVVPDAQPPLDRFHFAPNEFAGNLLFGNKAPTGTPGAGFESRELPPGWTPAAAEAGLRRLTPADVGPVWLRSDAADAPAPPSVKP